MKFYNYLIFNRVYFPIQLPKSLIYALVNKFERNCWLKCLATMFRWPKQRRVIRYVSKRSMKVYPLKYSEYKNPTQKQNQTIPCSIYQLSIFQFCIYYYLFLLSQPYCGKFSVVAYIAAFCFPFLRFPFSFQQLCVVFKYILSVAAFTTLHFWASFH